MLSSQIDDDRQERISDKEREPGIGEQGTEPHSSTVYTVFSIL